MDSLGELKKVLECPVCLDTYDDPRSLSCGHSFCYSCIESLQATATTRYTCAVCKQHWKAPEAGLQALVKNLPLRQMVEALNSNTGDSEMIDTSNSLLPASANFQFHFPSSSAASSQGQDHSNGPTTRSSRSHTQACTYSPHGMHRMQEYMACETCWGANSDYGVCLYCAQHHHAGHRLIHAEQEAGFVCDCGLYGHRLGLCTGVSTGWQRYRQSMYTCDDCFDIEAYRTMYGDSDILGVCYSCARACHGGQGHRVRFLCYADDFFCDCGRNDCCKTPCACFNPGQQTWRCFTK